MVSEAQKEANKRYRERNRLRYNEAQREYNKNYRNTNEDYREIINTINKKYYERHKEEISLKRKKLYALKKQCV